TIERTPTDIDGGNSARHQERDNSQRRRLAGFWLDGIDIEDRRMDCDVIVDPSQHGPQGNRARCPLASWRVRLKVHPRLSTPSHSPFPPCWPEPAAPTPALSQSAHRVARASRRRPTSRKRRLLRASSAATEPEVA